MDLATVEETLFALRAENAAKDAEIARLKTVADRVKDMEEKVTSVAKLSPLVNAALDWAKAERALRTFNATKPQYLYTPEGMEEAKHKVGLTCDWTEQKLLEAAEAVIKADAAISYDPQWDDE